MHVIILAKPTLHPLDFPMQPHHHWHVTSSISFSLSLLGFLSLSRTLSLSLSFGGRPFLSSPAASLSLSLLSARPHAVRRPPERPPPAAPPPCAAYPPRLTTTSQPFPFFFPCCPRRAEAPRQGQLGHASAEPSPRHQHRRTCPPPSSPCHPTPSRLHLLSFSPACSKDRRRPAEEGQVDRLLFAEEPPPGVFTAAASSPPFLSSRCMQG